MPLLSGLGQLVASDDGAARKKEAEGRARLQGRPAHGEASWKQLGGRPATRMKRAGAWVAGAPQRGPWRGRLIACTTAIGR